MEDYIKNAIEQMKRGEEKGFNTVYSATYNRVYFRAKQIMKKEEDAQDLTQIVFTEAYKNIHTLQTVEALYGWLDGITYHQGMKIYRKQKDVLLTEEAEGMMEEIESNDISSMPELTANQKATAEIIKRIIEELPELQRTAVVAYYFDGLSGVIPHYTLDLRCGNGYNEYNKSEEVLLMGQEELMNKIAELEREIAILPEGSITKKKIKDKEYYYHRITQNGKRVENYLSFEVVPELRLQIEKRKALEKELKELKVLVIPEDILEKVEEEPLAFKTIVRVGKQLKSQIALTKKYRKRECIKELREYIFGNQQDKVFIIYGLRRTGKTTLIRQILTELPDAEFKKAAFIQVRSKDTLVDVDADLRVLEEKGFKYVFIDEVTLVEDFIEGAAIFSDIYASSGMKIVLSGTDSLGFAFSKEEQLYDRCIMLHTTFIPYREFEEVLGIKGIDEYIRYGGTMSLGGINYNADTTFSNFRTAEEYIDTAIAKNIQHSLKMYQYGGHFRQLLDLYERGELTNIINRVVENINHSFTRSVVERTFKSHDISVIAANMLRDKENPINIKEHMDLDAVTFGIMQMLDILNIEEQSIDIEDSHMVQIKEYLTLLDLILEIDLESLPEVSQKGKVTVITQPGMRYAQANAIVENMLLDEKFQELSIKERQRILERLLNEIRGRMMEDIILLETKMAKPDKKVFKLQFAIGEFDMVVFDSKTLTCQIYEVKYSKEQVPEQYRHIKNEEKCAMTSHRYGDIIGRYVIYRGESAQVDGIQYLNVEEYLKSL